MRVVPIPPISEIEVKELERGKYLYTLFQERVE
jgi:hypothetical protein